MRKSRRIFIVIGLLIAAYLLLFQYINQNLGQYPVEEMPKLQPPEDMKNIIYWIRPTYGFWLDTGTKMFENCSYKNCYATLHKDEFPVETFDAVIFNGGGNPPLELPDKRTSNQVYIYGNLESPMYLPHHFPIFNNFYNWTFTYRMDSDIFLAYGLFEKKKTDYQPPSAQEIQKRPKKIAWFVSQCRTSSERELLTNEIQKYIPLDVYGSCGDLKCPRLSEECYKMMEKNYKFYLSFENSVCEDYVTEKLFNVLNKDVVPIVYGGADYDTMAPPKSVINVLEFKSLKDLVAYIRHLDTHPEEYLEFFEWKKDYVVQTDPKLAVCTLCQKLNEPIKPKVYSDLEKWWIGENSDKCYTNFIQNFL